MRLLAELPLTKEECDWAVDLLEHLEEEFMPLLSPDTSFPDTHQVVQLWKSLVELRYMDQTLAALAQVIYTQRQHAIVVYTLPLSFISMLQALPLRLAVIPL